MVPEGRRIFPDLTVVENLRVGAYLRKDDISKDIDWIYELFTAPQGALLAGRRHALRRRAADAAVARALMSRPKLMMMDEPSLGLAPLIVRDIFDIIKEINKRGVTILLIEQNANMALFHRRYRLCAGDRKHHYDRHRQRASER
jgi:branched-chain amino acid transport system ATP-binding protein